MIIERVTVEVLETPVESEYTAAGNQVSTNSSACNTGTEAIIQAMQRIRNGHAIRMLAGGSEGHSHYIWAGFDAMRVLNRTMNDDPEGASRPLSASAAGFIPGSGAGVLMLEELESAQARGAPIYAEILGGALNCGGHRQGGSMTRTEENLLLIIWPSDAGRAHPRAWLPRINSGALFH